MNQEKKGYNSNMRGTIGVWIYEVQATRRGTYLHTVNWLLVGKL